MILKPLTTHLTLLCAISTVLCATPTKQLYSVTDDPIQELQWYREELVNQTIQISDEIANKEYDKDIRAHEEALASIDTLKTLSEKIQRVTQQIFDLQQQVKE